MLVIDQKVAPVLFVFVARDFRLAGKLFGMLFPLLEALAEGFPILVNQDQDGVGNFARQSLIALQILHAMKNLRVGQVFSLMDERLSNLVGGLVIQVFRAKCSFINIAKARTPSAPQMLFN